MLEFKIICPECSAEIITASPEAVIWEHCPSCQRHLWDFDDLMMADLITKKHCSVKRRVSFARMHSS